MSKFYLTTPLYYVNASPHIGHAYTNIAADTLARFKRLKKEEVYFLTGTDEHGEKIRDAAEAEGKAPQEFVDEMVGNFTHLWKTLNISYDFFIRTTASFHQDVVKEAVEILFKKGDIYKSVYKGFYCVPCESFWTDSQVKEFMCPECKRPLEEIEESNYFFKLSKYTSWLLKYLKENPQSIKPKIRYNEVLGFLENTQLADLCISRPKKRVSWGVEFPFDKDYVVYVWFDALLNYISGAGYLFEQERFARLWPADCHFIGKDILRQHAIFWPIMLHALDLEPPRMVFAHGWWLIKEEKMSKSKGNIVNPLELVKELGTDSLRYFILREVPFGWDGNFSYTGLVKRINADLANDLGNLVYRTLNMAERYFEGRVESSKKDVPQEFKPFTENLKKEYTHFMDNLEFSSALERVWSFINTMNKYIEDEKPWVMWKERRLADLAWFIFSLLEGIRIVSVYIYPFMPQKSVSILRQLGCKIDESDLSLDEANWSSRVFLVKKEAPLFPRIDVD
jgi:methionyl-tRNA synthetase